MATSAQAYKVVAAHNGQIRRTNIASRKEATDIAIQLHIKSGFKRWFKPMPIA